MSIEGIDLNLIQVLHLVLAERSVVRAARRLHVTPSAISNSLARLRELLDDPLVTRKGRGIVPTPRAAELAPTIARAMHELETALFSAPFDPRSCSRTFTLAVADAGQLAFVPDLAQSMARALPQARLRVIGIDSLVSLGDLASSEIDVHVGVRHRGPGLHHLPLRDERTALIARRGHPLAGKRPSQRALETVCHVAVVMVPGQREMLADTYQKAGIRREVAVTVPTFTAAAAIVAATELVATVPSSFASTYGARFGVAVVGGAVPHTSVPLVLAWHERTNSDPASIAFRELVRSAAT